MIANIVGAMLAVLGMVDLWPGVELPEWDSSPEEVRKLVVRPLVVREVEGEIKDSVEGKLSIEIGDARIGRVAFLFENSRLTAYVFDISPRLRTGKDDRGNAQFAAASSVRAHLESKLGRPKSSTACLAVWETGDVIVRQSTFDVTVNRKLASSLGRQLEMQEKLKCRENDERDAGIKIGSN